MKKHLPLLIFFLVFSIFCQAQDECATMNYLKMQIAEDPSIELKMQSFEAELQQFISEQGSILKSTNGIVTIPVVFHILYKTDEQNIPDSRVREQMEALNRDFVGMTNHGTIAPFDTSFKANCGIQFCMAQLDPWGNFTTGIERREVTAESFSINDNGAKFFAKGGLDAWDPKKYMNIWVCTLDNANGYAQFPGSGINSTYGVVVDFICFGFTGTHPLYTYGTTTSHELGHCFDLRHIWGDDESACTGTDYCNDTPNQAGWNLDPPTCWGCAKTDACNSTPLGIMYMNFMDYSQGPYRTAFTPDQKTRILPLFSSRKGALYPLTQSTVCTPPAVTVNSPLNLYESSLGNNTATLNWDPVSGATSYLVQYMHEGGTWVSVTTLSNILPISNLLEGAVYFWRVQAVAGTAKSTYSTIMNFSTSGMPVCIMSFEPNNTKTSAAAIIIGAENRAGIHDASDIDWYTFTTAYPVIIVDLFNLPANFDVKLFNSKGVQLGVSQNTGTTNEQIVYRPSKPTTFYVQVYPAPGNSSNTDCYSVKVSGAAGKSPESGGAMEDNSVASMSCEVYPNPSNSTFSFRLETDSKEIVTIQIFDMSGRLVQEYKSLLPDDVIAIGSELKPGIYVASVIQGLKKKYVKIIKTN